MPRPGLTKNHDDSYCRRDTHTQTTIQYESCSLFTTYPGRIEVVNSAPSHLRDMEQKNKIHTYSRLIPEGVAETSQFFLRDVYGLQK
jgi:hypothetical protein